MPAEELIAEYVRIDAGRVIVQAKDPTQETGGISDSFLRVESANGLVSIIGRIYIGESAGPVLGRLCVHAGCSGHAIHPLRMKVSLRRRSGEGYEAIGELEIRGGETRQACFPARLGWGPNGLIHDGGELQFRLTVSEEQAAGPFTVAIRGVSFDRNP